jgi:hypothetical protein
MWCMSSPVVAVTPFGAALRRWRLARGASQLALANLAATTTRHVSFLETGRSRPSGEMVARLAEALELPLREANEFSARRAWPPRFRRRRWRPTTWHRSIRSSSRCCLGTTRIRRTPSTDIGTSFGRTTLPRCSCPRTPSATWCG